MRMLTEGVERARRKVLATHGEDCYWFRDPRIFLPRGASSWLLFLRELLQICKQNTFNWR